MTKLTKPNQRKKKKEVDEQSEDHLYFESRREQQEVINYLLPNRGQRDESENSWLFDH